MTIYQYDSGSPLRNQQLGQVTGTLGNVGHAQRQALPGHQLERRQRGRPHFSIPTLGINVPLYGNNGNANLCAAAPVHHRVAAPT